MKIEGVADDKQGINFMAQKFGGSQKHFGTKHWPVGFFEQEIN